MVGSEVGFFFLTLVFGYVQKTCFLTLVRNNRPMRVIMILIDVGATRYTDEGMDVMEFTEAESNIHDLM